MKYRNPVITGMAPDPSICRANGKYYLVTSSFHYFPGVPVYESDDLLNWKMVGHCLTRKSQIDLGTIGASGGIFAATIRYNDGRFYMITTNATTGQNFIVWTDNVYDEWSDPIYIDHKGIDPSLYFEDGHVYFCGNGNYGPDNAAAVLMCEINIETGEKIGEVVPLWGGSGGRYLESPHVYKIGNYYYLTVAEGGTEYGHMITYARSENLFGPYEGYSENPVITNRNMGCCIYQGMGHGDLFEDYNGNWWMVHLGFRQLDMWLPFHQLGRETFLTRVFWDENGWFTAANDGKVMGTMESDALNTTQHFVTEEALPCMSMCYIRNPEYGNYSFNGNTLSLRGSKYTLSDIASPTFVGTAQKEFDADITCSLMPGDGEAGLTVIMDDTHHYEVFLDESGEVKARIVIGTVKHICERTLSVDVSRPVNLRIVSKACSYSLFASQDGEYTELACQHSRYLSTEVACGFTGVMYGVYATGNGADCSTPAVFTDVKCKYRIDE